MPQIRRHVRRYVFTGSMMTALALFALVSGSHTESLTAAWKSRVGFAPRDLTVAGIDRLVLSALVTHGSSTFWRALAMLALLVGACEHRIGSWRAAMAFWGGHLVVLIVLGAGLRAQMSITGTTLAGPLPLPRDVGPSAGAFTCLGVLVAGLSPAIRARVVGAMLVVLAAALVLPPLADVAPAVDLLADMAHLLAFGAGLAFATWRRRAGHDPPERPISA